MNRSKSGVSLEQLTDALEAEILAVPDPELREPLRETTSQGDISVIRSLVARAIEEAEHAARPPPLVQTRPTLRRP